MRGLYKDLSLAPEKRKKNIRVFKYTRYIKDLHEPCTKNFPYCRQAHILHRRTYLRNSPHRERLNIKKKNTSYVAFHT